MHHESHNVLKQAVSNTGEVKTYKWQPVNPDIEEWTVQDAVTDLEALSEFLHGIRRVLTAKDLQGYLRGTKYEAFMHWMTHKSVWPRWANKHIGKLWSHTGKHEQETAIDLNKLREILVEFFKEIEDKPIDSDDEPPLVASANVMKDILGHIRQVGSDDCFSKLELKTYLGGTKYESFAEWLVLDEPWAQHTKDGKLHMYDLRRALQVYVYIGQPGSPSRRLGKRASMAAAASTASRSPSPALDNLVFSEETLDDIWGRCEDRCVNGEVSKLDFKTCLSGTKYLQFMCWLTEKSQWSRFSKRGHLDDVAMRAGLREYLEVDGPRAKKGIGTIKAAASLVREKKQRVLMDDSSLVWSEDAVEEMLSLDREGHDGKLSANELKTSLKGTIYEKFALWLTDHQRWQKHAKGGVFKAVDYTGLRESLAEYLGVEAPPPPKPPTPPPEPEPPKPTKSKQVETEQPIKVTPETVKDLNNLLSGSLAAGSQGGRLIQEAELKKALTGTKYEQFSTWLTDKQNWDKYSKGGAFDVAAVGESLADHIGVPFKPKAVDPMKKLAAMADSEDFTKEPKAPIEATDEAVKEIMNRAERLSHKGKLGKTALQTCLRGTKYKPFMQWLTGNEWLRFSHNAYVDANAIRAALQEFTGAAAHKREEGIMPKQEGIHAKQQDGIHPKVHDAATQGASTSAKQQEMLAKPQEGTHPKQHDATPRDASRSGLVASEETVKDIMRKADHISHNGKLSKNALQTYLKGTKYEDFMHWLTGHEWPRFSHKAVVDINAVRAALHEYVDGPRTHDENRSHSPQRHRTTAHAKVAVDLTPLVFNEETVQDIMHRADHISHNGKLSKNALQTYLKGTRYDDFMHWLTGHEWVRFSHKAIVDVNAVRVALREYLEVDGPRDIHASEPAASSSSARKKTAAHAKMTVDMAPLEFSEEVVMDIMRRADHISHNGKLSKNALQTYLKGTKYDDFMHWLTGHEWPRFSHKAIVDINAVRAALREYLEVDGPRPDHADTHSHAAWSSSHRKKTAAHAKVPIDMSPVVFSEEAVKDIMHRADQISHNGKLSKFALQTYLKGTKYDEFMHWFTGHEWPRFSHKAIVDIGAVRSALREFCEVDGPRTDTRPPHAEHEPVEHKHKKRTTAHIKLPIDNAPLVFSEGTVKDIMRRTGYVHSGHPSKSALQTNLKGTKYEAFMQWLTDHHEWSNYSSKGGVDINGIRTALHDYLGMQEDPSSPAHGRKKNCDLEFSDEIVKDILYLADQADMDGNGILDVYELQTSFQGTIYEDFIWWLTDRRNWNHWQKVAHTGVPGTIHAPILSRALLEYLEGEDHDEQHSPSSPSKPKKHSQVLVDHLNNKGQVVTEKFFMETSSTIWDVKKLIYKKKGVDYKRLLLSGCGELLEDGITLADPRVQGHTLELTDFSTLGGSSHRIHKTGRPERRGITLKQLSDFFAFIKHQRTKGKSHADDVFRDILHRADHENYPDKIRVSEFQEFFMGSIYEPFFTWLTDKPQRVKWQSKGHDNAGKIEKHQLHALLVEYLRPKGKGSAVEAVSEQTLFGWYDMDEQSATSRQPLQHNTFTMHHAVQWVIAPLTRIDRCSYVEIVSSKDADREEHPPEWFVCSSWWEPLINFSNCLSSHAKTRNLAQSTSLWICSFALRLEDLLPAELPPEEQQLPCMPLHNALAICNGFLLVLDSECKTFERIWCCMECLAVSQETSLLFDIVTWDPDDGTCSVLTDGLAANEQHAEESGRHYAGYSMKISREKSFPMSTILQASQDIHVEEAVATRSHERTYILRYLLHAPNDPLTAKQASRRLRSLFAAISWQHAILIRYDSSVLEALGKSMRADKTRQVLNLSFSGLQWFRNADLSKLMEALPPKTSDFEIDCMKCPEVDDAGVENLFAGLPEKLNALVVNMSYNKRITDRALHYIAAHLPHDLQKLRLELAFCPKLTDEGVADLVKSLPVKLVELELILFGCKNITAGEVDDVHEHLPDTLMVFNLDLDFTNAADAAHEKVDNFMESHKGLPRLEKQRLLKRHQAMKMEQSVKRETTKDVPESSKLLDPEHLFNQDLASNLAAPTTSAGSACSAPVGTTPAVDEKIAQFLLWAAGKWKMMYDLFSSHDDQQGQFLKSRSVSAKQFVEFVTWRGFQGAALHVFLAIQQEVDGVGRARQGRIDAPDRFGMISLPQLQRFAKRFADHASIGMDPPFARFSRALKQLRGCSLRAWQLDLDVRGTGVVAFGDFVTLCRRLGFTTEARALWNHFRPDSNPKGSKSLEFSEFDPAESENVEKLITVLWSRCQFNLDQVWMCIDPCCRGVVTPEEFQKGLDMIGFDGDAQLLYKGLDTSGVGKLVRKNMDYLQVLVHSSSRTKYTAPPVRALSKWTLSKFGSPKELLAKLHLKQGDTTQSLSPYDLAQQLVVLGFRGDARRFASFAADLGDSGRIDGALLYALLADVGGVQASKSRDWPKLTQSPVKKGPTPMARLDWQDNVEDFSKYNCERVHGHRSYFSIPTGGPSVILLEDNLEKKEAALLNTKNSGASGNQELEESDFEPMDEDHHLLDVHEPDSQPLTAPTNTPVETVARLTADALALHNMLTAEKASPEPSVRSVNDPASTLAPPRTSVFTALQTVSTHQANDQREQLVNTPPLAPFQPVSTPPLASFCPAPRVEASATSEAGAQHLPLARPEK